jgi:hypothetical protein
MTTNSSDLPLYMAMLLHFGHRMTSQLNYPLVCA